MQALANEATADGDLWRGRWRGKTVAMSHIGSIKAYGICADCNEWMGQEFENPTRSLIRDMVLMRVSSLDTSQQAKLARWSAKTMLMLGLAQQVPETFLPTSDLRAFRRSGWPSERSRVLLGTFSGDGQLPRRPSDLPVSGRVTLPQSPRAQAIGYQTHLIFGPLVIKYMHALPGPTSMPATLAERMSLLSPIWPPTGQPHTWPFHRVITPTSAPALEMPQLLQQA